MRMLLPSMRLLASSLALLVCLSGCDQAEPVPQPPVDEEPEFLIDSTFVNLSAGQVWLYDRTVNYGSNGSEEAQIRLTVIGDTLLQPPRFINDTLSMPLRYTFVTVEETNGSGTFIPSRNIAARYTSRGLEWFMSSRGGTGEWEPWVLPYPNGTPSVTSVRYDSPVDTREIEFRCAVPQIAWGDFEREQVTVYNFDCTRRGVLGIANRYDYDYKPVFIPRVALLSLYETGFGSFTEWDLTNLLP